MIFVNPPKKLEKAKLIDEEIVALLEEINTSAEDTGDGYDDYTLPNEVTEDTIFNEVLYRMKKYDLWDLPENNRIFKNEKIIEFFKERLLGEWKWGSRGARIRHKLHLEFGERFEWPDMGAPDCGNGVFCYGLSDHFGVLCDGSVVPCCLDSEGDITLGNILKENIDDILADYK